MSIVEIIICIVAVIFAIRLMVGMVRDLISSPMFKVGLFFLLIAVLYKLVNYMGDSSIVDTIRTILQYIIYIIFTCFCLYILFGGGMKSGSESAQKKRPQKNMKTRAKTTVRDDFDYYGDEEEFGGKTVAHRPNEWCCKYLLEYDSGSYNHHAYSCGAINSELPYDDARSKCFYREDYEQCQILCGKENGRKGRNSGMGKSPSGSCCRYLKEYESGSYETYSMRCEAVDEELPYDTARSTCFYSEDYEKCPTWQKNHS